MADPVSLVEVPTRREWDPEVLASLRERFEAALERSDWVVFFAVEHNAEGKLVVTATADPRVASHRNRVSWFEVLGFLQAKLNDWMREHLGGNFNHE